MLRKRDLANIFLFFSCIVNKIFMRAFFGGRERRMNELAWGGAHNTPGLNKLLPYLWVMMPWKAGKLKAQPWNWPLTRWPLRGSWTREFSWMFEYGKKGNFWTSWFQVVLQQFFSFYMFFLFYSKCILFSSTVRFFCDKMLFRTES